MLGIRTRNTVLISLLSMAMILAVIPVLAVPAYAAGEGQLAKICFDGDSSYEWAHFYSVASHDATVSLEDLNITVLDKNGGEIDPNKYDLSVERVYFDEEQNREVGETVTEPFGIIEADPNYTEGFTEYRAIATSKDDPEKWIEGRFNIMDDHSLNFICSETAFEGWGEKDGWRMHDRYWYAPNAEISCSVRHSGSGSELEQDRDYSVTYYRRSGSEEDLNNPEMDFDDILVESDSTRVDGAPSEPGAYFAVIEGISPYYGGNRFLIDITDDIPVIAKEIRLESEGDILWSDDSLSFNVDLPQGVEGKLEFYGGELNENSTSIYDRWNYCFNGEGFFDYDEDSSTLTLSGEKVFPMMRKYGNGHLDIQTRIIDDSTNPVTTLAEGCAEAELREAVYDYNLPENRDLLPEWSEWIDNNVHAWIENKEYPEGRDFDLEISDVAITDETPIIEGETVIELNGNAQDGWEYRGVNPGAATLVMTYKDYDGTEKTHEFTVTISDTVYNVNMWPVEGVYQGLPGGSIELQADAVKHTAETEKNDPGRWHHDETSEGLSYQWSIANGEEFATIKQNADDPTRATLTFKDMPEEWNRIGERVDVKIAVADANSDDADKERACRIEDFWVNNEYYQIYPATIDAQLDLGKTMTIDPELRFYEIGKEGYTTVSNVDFQIDSYDENALKVDKNGEVFALTRKTEWDTNFRLMAEWTNEGGEADSRDHWYHLNNRDYNIWFEHGDLDIYDDETVTIKTENTGLENLEDEINDPANRDYEIRYTVGMWNHEEENWERTLENSGYEVVPGGIRISGEAIKEAGLDGVDIRAELVIKREGNDDYYRDCWCRLNLRESCGEDNHKWVTAVIKEASCKEKGRQVKICLRHALWHNGEGCGKVVFEDIDFGPHKIQKVAAKDSTLTATGNTEHYKCSVCGKLFSDAAASNEISAASTIITKKIDIKDATIAAIPSRTYNKLAQKPALTVKYGTAALKEGTDYTVAYKNNTNAGKATATLTGKGKYAGTKAVTFTIAKAVNPIKLTAKKAKVKYSVLKKKNQTIKQTAACTVSGAQGKVSWKKSSGNAKITVASNGTITVKKGLKKGTYKVGLKATAAGNTNYKAGTKTATLTIVVN